MTGEWDTFSKAFKVLSTYEEREIPVTYKSIGFQKEMYGAKDFEATEAA